MKQPIYFAIELSVYLNKKFLSVLNMYDWLVFWDLGGIETSHYQIWFLKWDCDHETLFKEFFKNGNQVLQLLKFQNSAKVYVSFDNLA